MPILAPSGFRAESARRCAAASADRPADKPPIPPGSFGKTGGWLALEVDFGTLLGRYPDMLTGSLGVSIEHPHHRSEVVTGPQESGPFRIKFGFELARRDMYLVARRQLAPEWRAFRLADARRMSMSPGSGFSLFTMLPNTNARQAQPCAAMNSSSA